MRSITRWATTLLTIGMACARPVLYYPAPDAAAAPVSRAEAGPAPARADAAPALLTAAVVSSATSDAAYLRARAIAVPVAGADMSAVEDSFYAARDGERMHRAIDILAPRGTPVVAADDGRILRMTTSALGGITLYAVDPQNRLVYYYAHLDRYGNAMTPGRTIVKGDTLGYVGTTGNAPKDTPHLHFQVMRWPADGKYWSGEPIDPYDALGGVPPTNRGRRGGEGTPPASESAVPPG